MTYDVFGGTLNPTLLLYLYAIDRPNLTVKTLTVVN